MQLREFCLKYDDIYIYGAGSLATVVAKELERLGCLYKGFLVTKKGKNNLLYGHKIFSISEISLKQPIGVVLALNDKNAKEVIIFLEKNDFYDYYHYNDSKTIKVLPLRKRLQLLKEYKKDGSFVGALLSNFGTAEYRYRAYNIYQIMKKNNLKWKFVCFNSDEVEELKDNLMFVSSVTFVRLEFSPEINELVKKIREFKILLLYDIDDLVYDTNYIQLLKKGKMGLPIDFDYQEYIRSIDRRYRLALSAEAYTATNWYLAKKLVQKFSKQCFVIPNFLNEEQIEVAKDVKKNFRSNDFIIGYFSGSNSHNVDFKVCVSDLIRLLHEFNNIRLKIVGYLEIPVELDIFRREGRIEQLPLVDFVTLQQLMGDVDINIAPLSVDEVRNCKSELKFFEAAIMKTVTCASPSYVFRNCIENGVNGFLCRDDEWYDTIKNIYLGKFNIEQISDNAYKYALKNYSGKKISNIIEQVYDVLYTVKDCEIL